MKVAGGGFEPCDNGQLAVDMDSLLIGATDTVQACNDTQQVNPMLTQLDTVPDELGKPVNLVADPGYFSEAHVTACGKQHITPLIAVPRDAHHPDPLARVAEPPPLKHGATEGARMQHALLTMAGAGTLCETHMHRGAGHRHCQIGHEIAPILAARIGTRQR